MDLVSVIIPTHNREKTIVRAINSALCQTYKSIEVIVVDDCSTDNTREMVAKEFGNDLRVTYHRLEKNLGACAARNKGVQLSKGKYVAFLDSDDEFIPTKIAKQVSAIESCDAFLCASDYKIIEDNGNVVEVKTHSGSREEVYNELLFCNFITTGTLIGYKECFIDVPFDESLPRYQDWDLVLRLLQKYSVCFIHESTLNQYSQAVSISKSTNHEKTLNSLKIVYSKNIEGFKVNNKAYTQIHWLMGLHGLFVKNKASYKDLLIGATYSGLNFRRLGVMLVSLINKQVINKRI